MIENLLNEEQLRSMVHMMRVHMQQMEWAIQEAEAQLKYPQLKVGEEIRNEKFCKYLAAGYTVQAAYEMAHTTEAPKRKRRNHVRNTDDDV